MGMGYIGVRKDVMVNEDTIILGVIKIMDRFWILR